MAERLSALTIDSRHGQARGLAEQAIREVGQVILGKQNEIRLAVTCLLAQGHLLIEDVPGVGKTLLARSLAAVLGLSFRRIQFTSDLLPADITGASVFDQQVALGQQAGDGEADLVLLAEDDLADFADGLLGQPTRLPGPRINGQRRKPFRHAAPVRAHEARTRSRSYPGILPEHSAGPD